MFDKCVWPYSSVGRSYNFVTVFNGLSFYVLETECKQLKLIMLVC